jgi:DNA-binding MarR family transcriptional regulator
MQTEPRSEGKLHNYFRSVADARYVIRKAVRIVDDIAKSRGLDPLEHQALIQIYGARTDVLVRTVAERLDISPTFASKLVKALISAKFVTSHDSPTDLRASLLRVTVTGVRILEEIDAEVRLQVNMFTRNLKPDQKAAALAIFAFYVGAKIEVTDYHELAEIPFPSPRARKGRKQPG